RDGADASKTTRRRPITRTPTASPRNDCTRRELRMKVAIILGLTVLSGVGDAQGFVHATRIWSSGSFVGAELAKSAFGFGSGMVFYWLLTRSAGSAGIVSSEIQVLGWFAVTLTSVAI